MSWSVPVSSAASGTTDQSSRTRSSSRCCSAYAFICRAAAAARLAAGRARGRSCAAYQWWAICASTRCSSTSEGCVGEGLRDRGVERGVLAGQQVGVERLAQQRVPEGVPVLRLAAVGGAPRDQDRGVDRLAERRA